MSDDQPLVARVRRIASRLTSTTPSRCRSTTATGAPTLPDRRRADTACRPPTAATAGDPTTTEPDAPLGRGAAAIVLVVVDRSPSVVIGVIAVGDDDDDGETGVGHHARPVPARPTRSRHHPRSIAIDAPAATTRRRSSTSRRPRHALVSPPDFESVPGVSADELAQYDLTAAVGAQRPGRRCRCGRCSRSRVRARRIAGEIRPASVSVTLSVERPDRASRDSRWRSRSATARRGPIVDRADGHRVPVEPALPGGSLGRRSPKSEVLEDTGAVDLDELFDALRHGTDHARPAGGGDGDAVRRRWSGSTAAPSPVATRSTSPSTRSHPLGALMFAGSPDRRGRRRRRRARLRFQVYVTDQPALALVISRFDGRRRAADASPSTSIAARQRAHRAPHRPTR